MASLIGKEIGKYRITERIGRGGMADVYRGIHTHLDRPVAVKVLHGHLMEGGDFIERFKREAKAVANLRHPNIVQVHDFDIQGDLILMVMEYIDGTNLQQKLVELDKAGERLPITQIASIVSDIAGALDYAHSQGMLHRDVKPSNIMLDSDGKAYLTDFGIAKIVGDNKLTATGTLIGTPAYMSPEQGRGEELTEESDIYSLGVVAFEMLTGHVPYDAKTPIGIVHKQISEPVPRITELVDGVPVSAQEVIDRALAKTPEGRFSSADELTGALRLALEALEATEDVLVQPTIEMDPSEQEKLSAPTMTMEPKAADDEPKPAVAPPGEKEKTSEEKVGRLSVGAWIGIGAGVLVAAVLLLTFVFDVIPLGSVSQSSYSAEAEELFEEGVRLFDDQDFEGALEIFNQVSESGFESAELYWYAGTARRELGDIYGAIEDLNAAVELDPDYTAAWYNLAEAYHNTWGDQYKDEAHWAMDHALELEPDNPDAHWLMGRIRYYQFNNPDEAIQDLSRAIELRPDYALFYNMRGVIFMETGQWEECVADYNEFAARDPENPWAYYERGLCYQGLGEVEMVRDDFERFLELTEETLEFDHMRQDASSWLDENPEAGSSAEDLFEEGVSLFDVQDYDGALEVFDQAAENGYESSELYWYAGSARRELGDFYGAIGDLKTAVEMDPDNTAAWYNLAESYYNTGEGQYKDEAHQAMDIVLEAEPDNPNAHWLIGVIRLEMFGNPEEAIQDFTRAIELDPTANLYYHMLASAYQVTGEWMSCIANENEAAALGSEDPFVYLRRGECYLEVGETESTRADYERFLEMTEGKTDLSDARQEVQNWLDDN